MRSNSSLANSGSVYRAVLMPCDSVFHFDGQYVLLECDDSLVTSFGFTFINQTSNFPLGTARPDFEINRRSAVIFLRGPGPSRPSRKSDRVKNWDRESHAIL